MKQILQSITLRDDALALWGLNGNKPLPAEGAPTRWLGPKGQPCLMVFIQPSAARKGEYKPQRLRAICPGCNEHFALGNLAQHMGLQAVGRKRTGRLCKEVL